MPHRALNFSLYIDSWQLGRDGEKLYYITMTRINPYGMRKSLSTSFGLVSYFHYTSDEPDLDPITQNPIQPGEIVTVNTDIQDFTIQELKVSAGLINVNSKKYIVELDNDLVKGDEVLDSSNLEIYRVVSVSKFANRKWLFCNQTTEDANQH